MFKSATVKLTTWYLLILIAISLLFSVVIYLISSAEVGTRIGNVERNSPFRDGLSAQFEIMRSQQVHEAEANLISSLVLTNLCIWLLGGIGSYYLARRTLRPIEETHEAQSRFTSDASHELRTPLASMKTELEVALRDPALKKNEMRELLESNLEEVDKLTKLSHSLLQLARLDHSTIEREPVDIVVAARSAIERFDKTGRRISLATGKTGLVLANKAQADELLTILIDNALKYSPADTKVSVTTIRQHQMAGFEITNEGEGIPPSRLSHIFDRFYRVDASRTNDSRSGYGLGLSLAKKIVQLHSGELSVSSAPGQLTTFRVLLPVYYEPHPRRPRRQNSAAKSHQN